MFNYLSSGVICLFTLALMAPTLLAQESDSQGDYIRLVAALDEPELYCIDLAGWGKNLRLEDPLQTHTCKRKRANDQLFLLANDRIHVAGYDRCIQVAGSGDGTLVGSAVLARECSDNPLQQLTMDEAGQIRVGQTNLCVGAGSDSLEASGPSHMWRTLGVVSCEDPRKELTTWQIGLH